MAGARRGAGDAHELMPECRACVGAGYLMVCVGNIPGSIRCGACAAVRHADWPVAVWDAVQAAWWPHEAARPLVLRGSYTLGGAGVRIARTRAEFEAALWVLLRG